MVERGGAAFGRLGRVLLAVVVLAVGAQALWAQGTTGKVEGTVSDPSGQPVAGAQVLVRGTALGAVTNSSGYYFINNVPAGTYTLMAVYIGFQPNEVRNVRVLADQTLTVNFGLQSAVELGAITVTVSENPIVPRDQVTSKSIVTGALVEDLPVDNVRDVMALAPGVVESGASKGLSIRGGRPGEAAVYVDGALVRSARTGAARLSLGTNALEEASLTTGAVGAEFSEAQSGVIAVITRGGGPRFTSTLSYQTDEMFGDNISVGYNRAEASVGGPVFGNLTFYLSGTVDGRKSGFRGKGFENERSFVYGPLDTTVQVTAEDGSVSNVDIPTFLQASGSCTADASQGMAGNYGYECSGRRAPYNWSTAATGQAKLQYTYGSGSRLSATYLYSQDQNRNWNTGFNYQSMFGSRSTSTGAIVAWTQSLLRGTERALAFDVNLSAQSDGFISGALTQDYEVAHRSPGIGWVFSPMDFIVNFDHFSDDDPNDPLSVRQLKTQADWDQLIYNVRTNQGTRTPYLGRSDLYNSQPYRMNPWAIQTGLSTSGLDYRPVLSQERRWNGRVNVDFQLDRYNRFKFGGDLQSTRVNYFQSSTNAQRFMEVWSEQPIRTGFYAEDRLDLGDVVIDLGIRWDYFDTGVYFENVPGRLFSHPDFNRDSVITDAVFTKAQRHKTWSPRVRVSFPVTDQTGFRLSYAHQVQTPSFDDVLSEVNSDLSFTNTNSEFARDVTFGKSVLFEFGIRHAFNDDFVLDLSAYNKDKVADLTFRNVPFLDPATNREIFINVLTNLDFGNVRGLDMSLQRRFGDFFNGTLSYTLLVAKNTGSDPQSYLSTTGRQVSSVLGERVDPPQAILPTNDNRTHNIAGALSFTGPSDFAPGTFHGAIFRNAGAFVRFRFASGLPYTPTTNTGGGETAPFVDFGLGAIAAGPINSRTLPWITELDVRVTKGFGFGMVEAVLFADIRNLLNLTVTEGAYTETGDVRNDLHRSELTSPEVSRLQQEAGSFLRPDKSIGIPADCGAWGGGPVNCVLIKRAEQRWGDGDGIYTLDEYQAAFDAQYYLSNAPYQFYAAPRHIRLGLELRF
jgi:hypothetical protein